MDNWCFFCRLLHSSTIGHSFKMWEGKFKCGARHFIRVVGAWNILSGEVVEPDTIMIFKGLLEKQMNMDNVQAKGFFYFGIIFGTSVMGWRVFCSCPVHLVYNVLFLSCLSCLLLPHPLIFLVSAPATLTPLTSIIRPSLITLFYCFLSKFLTSFQSVNPWIMHS